MRKRRVLGKEGCQNYIKKKRREQGEGSSTLLHWWLECCVHLGVRICPRKTELLPERGSQSTKISEKGTSKAGQKLANRTNLRENGIYLKKFGTLCGKSLFLFEWKKYPKWFLFQICFHAEALATVLPSHIFFCWSNTWSSFLKRKAQFCFIKNKLLWQAQDKMAVWMSVR